MTQEISGAQQNALESQRRAESEHAYLDTVLTHLSAGAPSSRVQPVENLQYRCDRILGSDLTTFIGQPINQLAAVRRRKYFIRGNPAGHGETDPRVAKKSVSVAMKADKF